MLTPPFDQRLLFADLGVYGIFQQLPVAHRGGQRDQRVGLCQAARRAAVDRRQRPELAR
ncbi:MAG: hypothetical protein ACJ8AW_54795 [Rhodopila sp.]